MRQAPECCQRGRGVVVVIGVARAGQEIQYAFVSACHRSHMERNGFGPELRRTKVPKIVDWYVDGKIRIDELITQALPLD